MSSSEGNEALPVRLAARVRAAFDGLRREHPEESFYFFALFTDAEGSYVCPSAWSEEALARVVQQYRDPHDRRSLEAWAKRLRFASADSPYFQDDFDGQEAGPALHDACFSALSLLDRDGFFGSGAEREKVIVNVVHGDMSDELWFAHAERLNPGPALEQARPFLTLHVPSGPVRAWGSALRQVTALALSADRSLVMYSGANREVGVLNSAERKPHFETKQPGIHWACALSPGGSQCFLGVPKGVLVLEALRGKRLRLLDGPAPSSLALSPDGSRLAVSAFNAPLRVVAAANGAVLWTAPDTTREALAFSPCGRWLASATPSAPNRRTASLACFDAASGALRWRTQLGRGPKVSLAWSAPGDELLVSVAEGTYSPGDQKSGHGAVAWFSAEGHRSQVLSWTHPVDALACAPTGSHFALCAGPLIVVFDRKGRELARGTGTQQGFSACAFLSDKRLLAAGTDVNCGPALLELAIERC